MKRKQSILLECERMKYPYAGLYYFCLYLGKALLRKRDQLKEDITFYVPKNVGAIFGPQESYLIQRDRHKLIFPSVDKFDIWHSTVQASPYAPRSSSIKRVVTIHDLNFLYEHKQRPEKIKRMLGKIQKQIDKTDRICAISAFTKSDIIKHLDVKGKTIEVIYNGCNIETISDPVKPANQPNGPFIFTIGTIMAKKNFHVLPALLVNNDMKLVIAGVNAQPAYLEKIKTEARKYRVADRVVFTGIVSENDKQWYLKNCDAFAFPSIAEGFGLPVVEAMAFGKPIFLSTYASLPEIGGDLAYYFQSFDKDAMIKTFDAGMAHYQHNATADKIIARARFFNWDTTAKQYLSVYRSLNAS